MALTEETARRVIDARAAAEAPILPLREGVDSEATGVERLVAARRELDDAMAAAEREIGPERLASRRREIAAERGRPIGDAA